jgi:hypothetical protein
MQFLLLCCLARLCGGVRREKRCRRVEVRPSPTRRSVATSLQSRKKSKAYPSYHRALLVAADKARRLTREEREEAYNRARERIFGTNEKAENANPDNDDQVDASRASSISGKDRSNLGKRGKTGRQRREDSESFDSRSNYIHVYGPTQQQGWLQPQYVPMPTAQYVSQPQYQPTYTAALPQSFPPQQQAYQPPVAPSNGFMTQPYPNMPQVSAPRDFFP